MTDHPVDEDARASSLIPHDSVSGRALTVVIAILTFLACLTAGGAVLLADASAAWREDVSREITVQIKPGAETDADAAVEKALAVAKQSAAVASARALGRDETERSLAPWLGSGLDLSQLPIPRLVIVTLASRDAGQIAELRDRIEQGVPGAVFDDNAVWLTHLSAAGRSLTLFAGLLFLLVVAAIAIAVGFATRAAMAGAREIVEVLHFVGASDRFIAAQFQRHFLNLGFRGSLAGGGAAALGFLIASLLSWWWKRSPGGAELAALFGAFSLDMLGYFALLAICIGVTLLTAYLSRWIVLRHLRGVQ
jgi:cell division transport system permease protein